MSEADIQMILEAVRAAIMAPNLTKPSQRLSEMNAILRRAGMLVDQDCFRNRENGEIYRQVGVAKDCTGEGEGEGLTVAVYRPLGDPSLLFVRERVEFGEKFSPLV